MALIGCPVCPAGGTYTYRPAGDAPECSVHGRLGSGAERGARQRSRRD